MTETAREDRFIRFSIAMDTILKKIQKYKNDHLSDFGLRSMHLMFMYCLFKEQHGLTAGELSQMCSVDKAFISRITNDLRELGYVEYASPEKNAHYKKHLHLTENGKKVMNRVNEMIGDAVEKISSGISSEQLETFYTVLAVFDNNLLALSGD